MNKTEKKALNQARRTLCDATKRFVHDVADLSRPIPSRQWACAALHIREMIDWRILRTDEEIKDVNAEIAALHKLADEVNELHCEYIGMPEMIDA